MSIVSVQITKVSPHPNASKLHLCEVSDGKQTTLVVCGARNVQVNMKTLLAELGSTLPSGKVIEKAALRGRDSFGMLCSPKDLDISQENGIIDLDPKTDLGLDFKNLDKKLLSSTPWYRFKLVDSIVEEENKNTLVIIHAPKQIAPCATLYSQTYWDGQSYKYRHFK